MYFEVKNKKDQKNFDNQKTLLKAINSYSLSESKDNDNLPNEFMLNILKKSGMLIPNDLAEIMETLTNPNIHYKYKILKYFYTNMKNLIITGKIKIDAAGNEKLKAFYEYCSSYSYYDNIEVALEPIDLEKCQKEEWFKKYFVKDCLNMIKK